jgi:hypothetical protein
MNTADPELNAYIASLNLPTGPKAQWQPLNCGRLAIHIDSNGQWWHEGTIVKRHAMVKLWASVLRVNYPEGDKRAPGIYHLTTPIEDIEITVEDVPFVIINWQSKMLDGHEVRIAIDNLERHWPICERYPLILKQVQEDTLPYLVLNNGLLARVHRNVYYQWAELLESDDKGYWLKSAGMRFLMARD